MADIFLSYSQKDLERAKQVAEALEAAGWGLDESSELNTSDSVELKLDAKRLRSAKCILVLWSKASVNSHLVIGQANIGKRRDVLVQAVVDDVNPPPQFHSLVDKDQPSNLIGWTGDPEAKGFRDLKVLIERHVPAIASPTVKAMIRRKAALFAEPRGSQESPPPHRDLRPSTTDGKDTGRASDDSFSVPQRTPTSRKQTRTSKPKPAPPRRVFLCYRRQDTQGHTGRLRDRLVATYGKDAVFMDVDDVPHGIDFVEYIEGVLTGCAVMVVMIGQQWITIADRKGRRRLDQPKDLLRGEIAAALNRNIPMIPVLVEDAAMPDEEDVPEDIRGLTRRTTVELTHRRWEDDVQRVLKVIEKFMWKAKSGS